MRKPEEIDNDEILTAITKLTSHNGYPPTTRELCEQLGVKSTASMHFRLKDLRKLELVSWIDKCSRTLKVTEL